MLKTAIQHRFGCRPHADDARDLLTKRKRGVEESLGAYAADLRAYARRGHPDFGETVQEELAVQAFIRGLQPERLKEYLRLHAPSTLTAALAEAERVEHVLCPEGHCRSDTYRVSQVTCEDSDEEAAVRQVSPALQQRSRRRPEDGYYRTAALQVVATSSDNDCETIDPQQLRQDHQQDPVLAKVHAWVGASRRPEWAAVAALDLETKALYSQWPSIVSQEVFLYRRWKSPGGQQEILQLLVPRSLWSRALKLVQG
ncbi:unnamed protein product [Lampetra planeri]